jgi:hypothetical protein
MAEEVAGMVEASVVAVAISVAAISPAAVVISVVVGAVSTAVISVGLAGVVLVAIALRNTEEGISSTGITSSMETVSGTKIGSGTIAISFLEVPFCMITPTMGMTTLTMGMIILTTGIIIRTTDIGTTGIMGTTDFAVNRLAVLADSTKGQRRLYLCRNAGADWRRALLGAPRALAGRDRPTRRRRATGSH